ncbi:VQ motif-containing protein 10-like [Chenopodium quinoa]|uniref:VQ domain-containing protein n=1 Tax=Chenopodium quinoa TaxID=63459 RepID=A0A803MCA8_CHEQI|nr:VQ motif-containing protein 10-like [Chenopodium quinoa]
MSSRSKLRQPLKVVHIKTQYVETDACSFKSVVQDLTGKDSTIAYAPSTSRVMKVSKEKISARPQSRLARTSHGPQTTPEGHFMLDCCEGNNLQDCMGRGSSGGGTYSFLSRNLSYKEMDRLLKELPPLDDLHKVLSFD